MNARVLDAGDAAFTVEFGDRIDPALLAAVNALDIAIAREQAAGRLPGLIETMPTFRSLTVFFDPLLTGRAALLDALQPLFDGRRAGGASAGRQWRLPVCYDGEAGPDLADTARAIGASVDEVIALHSGTAGTRVHARLPARLSLHGRPAGDAAPAAAHRAARARAGRQRGHRRRA